MNKLYRVILKTAFSVQPGGTFWVKKVLYMGDDVQEARIAYHKSEPEDFHYGYGSRARVTEFELLDQSELEDEEVGEFAEFEDDIDDDLLERAARQLGYEWIEWKDYQGAYIGYGSSDPYDRSKDDPEGYFVASNDEELAKMVRPV